MLERGHTTTQAAWALGPGGARQTVGRTLYAALARRTTVTARPAVLVALRGITAASSAVPGPYPPLVPMSVAAGMVWGNLPLVQATAVTDRRGATHHGRLSGPPAATAAALAPFAGAALTVPLGGYPHLFATLARLRVASVLALSSRARD